ncbi:bifunctional lysylphosphatidylglycerol flippase/synthetase MprF [Leifsonia sp. McL0607]|uniref:bifunctional lysylphosphatidylglycerol flippase/synthetase MprF n=1 Tax=Leifsonia sp. McL0607 TaxID=3415672 RepID=UPI003CE89E49
MDASAGGNAASEPDIVPPQPPAPASASGVRGVLQPLGRLVAGHPFTTGLTAAILVLALVTGPIHGPHRPLRVWLGAGPDQLLDGHWWSPVTAVLFTDNLAELIVVLVLTIVLVGAAERLMGTWRTALAFVATSVIGIAAGIGVELLGSQTGEMWSRNVHHLVALDVFTGIAGTIMTASAFAGTLWRRRVRVITLLVAIMLLLYSGLPSDLYRLLAVLAGLALGVLLRRHVRRARWRRSSHHEVRVLLASAVTITALGPVIGLLAQSRFGMLSPIGLLFSNDVPETGSVLERCQAFAVTRSCVHDLTLERINGIGPVLISVLPLLTLLVAAYGLLRGRRFAVWLAVAVNALLAVLSALYFGILPFADPRPTVSPRYWEVTLVLALSALVPAVLAVLLVVYRRHFTVLATARSVRRYALIVVLTGVGLIAFYVLVGWLQKDTGFTRPIDVSDLLNDVLERFIPVSFLRREPVQYLPTTPLATVVYHNIGTVFWLVVILAAVPFMLGRGAWRRSSGDASRVRSLLQRGGGDAISFMATWPGNSYWFDAASGGAVAYRVLGRVALTTGAPFGTPQEQHDGIIERFARFCDDSGWIPVFYSVDAEYQPLFDRMGWSTMTVAEETVIRPQQWATTGKKWQDVRSSINRAQRAGIRSEWTTFSALPLSTAVQLSDISEQWVAEKDLPEMGFTLGGLDELHDPAVRLMLAIDEVGRVEGVTSWLPSYRDGHVVGWTLDFMRRRPGSINGVMEFLIAEAATRMKEDGIEFMSLSAAPLAHTADTTDDTKNGMDRVLGYLSTSLEPVYGFRSLLKFKQKFQPELHPLIMAYPDPVALPAIGVGLVRAYLPDLSVRQAAALAVGRG